MKPENTILMSTGLHIKKNGNKQTDLTNSLEVLSFVGDLH